MYEIIFQQSVGESFEFICGKVISCLKEMYKLAREMKIVTRLNIIQEVLNIGFAVAATGERESTSSQRKDQFLEDSKIFANLGFKLATIVFGETHSDTQIWKERRNKQWHMILIWLINNYTTDTFLLFFSPQRTPFLFSLLLVLICWCSCQCNIEMTYKVNLLFKIS